MQKIKHNRGLTMIEILYSLFILTLLGTACFSISTTMQMAALKLESATTINQIHQNIIETTRIELRSNLEYFPTGRTQIMETQIGNQKATTTYTITTTGGFPDFNVHKLELVSVLGAVEVAGEVFLYDPS